MLIGLIVLIALASVPLFGGNLGRLADLGLRLVWLAVGALAVQVLIVNVIPGAGSHGTHAAIAIATYVVLAGVIAANIRIPGVAIVALGGLGNALAIVANGGVMPASASALATAGLEADPGVYTNSALVEHARLAFLGDVFAIPASIPAANVFSVGDILLAVGAGVVIHHACGSRLVRRRRPAGATVTP